MTHPDKPYLSISEQINHLQQRGLLIDNEMNATKHLLTIGYYPLINGYGKPYTNANNKFIQGVTFEQILSQYQIDQRLKQFLFQEIINCENRLKTLLGYFISNEFGVWDEDVTDLNRLSYLHQSHYANNNQKNNVLKKLIKTKREISNNPTKYYRDSKNHIPPWILFSNCSMWEINNLFRILQPQHKNKVANEIFNPAIFNNDDFKLKLINDSYELLREFRNCVAHGSRLYSYKSKAALPLKAVETLFGPGLTSATEHNKGLARNDLFALILTIIIFSPEMDASIRLITGIESIKVSFNDEKSLLNPSPFSKFLEFSNLPTNFVERLTIGIQYCINNHQLYN